MMSSALSSQSSTIYLTDDGNVIDEMTVNPRKFKIVVSARKSIGPTVFPACKFSMVLERNEAVMDQVREPNVYLF